MRKLRITVAFGVVALVGLWAIFVSEPHHIPNAPTAVFVSAEPSGLIDDSGAELLLVIFAVNNTNRLGEPSDKYRNTIWFKDPARLTEANVRNRWIVTPAASASSREFRVGPGQKANCLLLVPIEADSCRVRLQYTGERTSYPPTLKGVSLSIVAKLPLSVRSRISYKFWRWVGFPKLGPDTKWQEVCVELPLAWHNHQRMGKD
jgi:hypothetical protein